MSDSVAPPSTASAAPEAKVPGKPVKETSLSVMSVPTTALLANEREARMRKGSEPPPSLQGLFDHSMGSSRRWVHKQLSADELQANHPKQHSFDSSHLRAVTPQSPKHSRRVKSPSTCDRTSSNLESAKIPRTPSHPHLNSATSSPQVSRAPNKQLSSETIVRAHSSQQLKMESDNEEEGVIMRSSSGGKSDLSQRKSEHYEGLMISSGLKLEKDREVSQSKESLNSQKDSSVTDLKKSPSRESLKGVKETNTPVGLKEMVLSRELRANSQSSSAILTSYDYSKESRERSTPHKDTQTSAESSVESTQAPLINQQVCTRVYI